MYQVSKNPSDGNVRYFDHLNDVFALDFVRPGLSTKNMAEEIPAKINKSGIYQTANFTIQVVSGSLSELKAQSEVHHD